MLTSVWFVCVATTFYTKVCILSYFIFGCCTSDCNLPSPLVRGGLGAAVIEAANFRSRCCGSSLRILMQRCNLNSRHDTERVGRNENRCTVHAVPVGASPQTAITTFERRNFYDHRGGR